MKRRAAKVHAAPALPFPCPACGLSVKCVCTPADLRLGYAQCQAQNRTYRDALAAQQSGPLSLLDHFAGLAMAAILAKQRSRPSILAGDAVEIAGRNARGAYIAAAAMIVARGNRIRP